MQGRERAGRQHLFFGDRLSMNRKSKCYCPEKGADDERIFTCKSRGHEKKRMGRG